MRQVSTEIGPMAARQLDLPSAQYCGGNSLTLRLFRLGTWSVASGTSYEAEKGVRSGSSTILSDTSFSGDEAVGYLG